MPDQHAGTSLAVLTGTVAAVDKHILHHSNIRGNSMGVEWTYFYTIGGPYKSYLYIWKLQSQFRILLSDM